MLLLADTASEWSSSVLIVFGMAGSCLVWLTVNFFKAGVLVQRVESLESRVKELDDQTKSRGAEVVALTAAMNAINNSITGGFAELKTLVTGIQRNENTLFDKFDKLQAKLEEHGEKLAVLTSQRDAA